MWWGGGGSSQDSVEEVFILCSVFYLIFFEIEVNEKLVLQLLMFTNSLSRDLMPHPRVVETVV